jgi:hypothetical protein
MADVPTAESKPGYNFDPYAGEGAEADDVISKLFEPISGKGGLFSTWRERHIAIAGASAGYRAGVFSNVPACPPLWADEAQYFDGMAMITNVAKTNIPGIIGTAGGIIVALQATGIFKIIPGLP